MRKNCANAEISMDFVDRVYDMYIVKGFQLLLPWTPGLKDRNEQNQKQTETMSGNQR